MTDMSKEAIQKGIDALRGVIAWDIMRNHLIPHRVRDPIHEAIEALAALAEQQPPVQQETVETVKQWRLAGDSHWENGDPQVDFPRHPIERRTLYTFPQPAQRKPLTDEEIAKLDCVVLNQSDWNEFEVFHPSVIDLARAIEAAHGIKENT